MTDKPFTFTEAKGDIARVYGLPIIGTGKYFENSTPEMSKALREFQEFVNAVVVAHDSLADQVAPNRRLVGKRGRKTGGEKKVTTVDDVISRLTK